MKIKKGDKVKVLSGKDRGKLGVVQKVFAKTRKVIVEGANLITKFEKLNHEKKTGGMVKVEGPMSVSKVQLIDPKTEKATRIGYKLEKDKKVRITKKSKTVI